MIEQASHTAHADDEQTAWSAVHSTIEALSEATSFNTAISILHNKVLSDAAGVCLASFEQLDSTHASFLEINASIGMLESGAIYPRPRARLPLSPEQHTHLSAWQHEPVWYFKASESPLNVSAEQALNVLTIPLKTTSRLWGLLQFCYPEDHRVSEVERAQAAILGNLLPPVLERIRAQQDSAQADESLQFLYRLAAEVNAATTTEEVLEAASAFAPDCDGLYLTRFDHMDYTRAAFMEIVAAAKVPEHLRILIGIRGPVSTFPVLERLREQSIWTSEDVLSDPTLDPVSRETWTQIGTQAVAIIRLMSGERFVGFLTYNYTHPRVFNVHGKRIAQGVGNLVMSALERLHFQSEIQSANAEAAFLYRLAETVNAITSYQGLMDAVGQLQPDTHGIYLALWENSDFDTATCFEFIAGYNVPPHMQPLLEHPQPIDSFPMVENLRGQRLIAVEDVDDDPRFPPETRAQWLEQGIKAIVALPLLKGDRFLGGLFFHYANPREFNARDRQIKLGITELVLAAVERISSQNETLEAKEESAILYALAESINAATTYQAICEAVATLVPDSDGIYVDLWETLDYETADYLEIVASANVPQELVKLGLTRLPKSDFPVLERIHHQRITVIENIYSDPNTDPVTRKSWERLGTKAMILLFLHKDGRNIGCVFVNYTRPRTFSDRERRIALGIGELVLAATERIRLQLLTEIAHERAEIVASINAALLRATDEASILAAVEAYVEAQGATEMILTYAETDTVVHNTDFYPVARWLFGDPDPYQLFVANMGFHQIIMEIRNLSIREPEKIFYIEDIENDARFPAEMRADFVQQFPMRAEAVVGLYSGGRWQGSLVIIWHQPHRFSEQEKHVYAQLLQNLPSVVATRRAYLAEQASRAENEQLYSVSKAINQATTIEAVAETIERCFPDPLSVILLTWEHYNRSEASYAEVIVSNNPTAPLGVRRQRDELLSFLPDVGALSEHHREPGGNWKHRPSTQCNMVSIISANLIQDQRVLGALVIGSAAPYTFTDSQMRLISALTDLTAAAIERFRLHEKTEIARQQAESLAYVSSALSQATNEHGILEALSGLMLHYGVKQAALSYSIYDTRHTVIGMRVVSMWTPSAGIVSAEKIQNVTQSPGNLPLLKIIFRNPESPLIIEDVSSDSRLEIQQSAAIQKAAGCNAQILIPLYSNRQLYGTLSFIWNDTREFGQGLRTLVNELQRIVSAVVSTRQAFLTTEQARKETEQRVRELETFAEVSAAAAAIRDEQQLLRTFVHLMQTNFAPNDVRVYLLADDDTLVLWTPPDEHKRPAPKVKLHEKTPIAYAVKNRRVVLEAEAGHLDQPLIGLTPSSMHYSSMDVPMIVNQEVVGVLSLRSPSGKRTFTESDTRVTSTMADLIAVAIQNARFFQQAQELAALEERTRLARELHDSVSQALYGIGLGAQTARRALDSDPQVVRESVEYVLTLAEAGLAEMRALIFELRPESLETEGLVVALAKQGASLQARHGVEVFLELAEEPTLPLSTKESLYRVAREALHNIIKHAAATRIILRMQILRTQNETSLLRLQVIDNGIGFEIDQEFPGHLGLHSMRERMRQLNGAIDIMSEPGKGTSLTVTLPLSYRHG